MKKSTNSSKAGAKAKAADKKPAGRASKTEVKEPVRKTAEKAPAKKTSTKAKAEKATPVKAEKKAPAKVEKKTAAKAGAVKAAVKAEKTSAKPEKAKAAAKAKEEKPKARAAEAEAAETPAPRKRGRPRKSDAQAAEEPAKGRRGRKPKGAPAEEEAAPAKSRDAEFNPDLEEEPDLDEDFDIGDEGPAEEPEAEVVAPKRKPKKATRKRRSRQLPRVPDRLRAFPAWAEAWTALAEAGIEAQLIPAVLRDASHVFLGLNELTHASVEALFHFWEVSEVPAGIESILEEAFLSQPPQPESKPRFEAFFREVMATGDINDALALLWTARNLPDWRIASQSLDAAGSPFADNVQLFALAREIVG